MEPLHKRFQKKWHLADYFPHISVCHPTRFGCWIIKSYHKDGKHTLTFVGCMYVVSGCASVPFIGRLVFQVSANHVWTTLMLPTDRASQKTWIISNTVVRNSHFYLPKFHLYITAVICRKNKSNMHVPSNIGYKEHSSLLTCIMHSVPGVTWPKAWKWPVNSFQCPC